MSTRSERKKTKAQIEREVAYFLSHADRPGSPLRRRVEVTRFEPMMTPRGIEVADGSTARAAARRLEVMFPSEPEAEIARLVRAAVLARPSRSEREIVRHVAGVLAR